MTTPPNPTVRDLVHLLTRMDARLSALEAAARTSQLQHASLTGTAIRVYDEDGTTPRGAIGIQPDGTIGLVATGGPAPGAPTAPAVEPSLGGLRVTWDGALADGSDLPSDFDHVAVHVSTSSGFDPGPATFAGTITRAGSGGMLPVTPLPYQEHYVRLVGVTTSATEGPASEETAATPLRVDGPDLKAGSVTAAAISSGAVEADKLATVLALVTRIVAGAPAGARVELNQDGLRVYNGDGELTVRFDASTGDAVFTGTVTGSAITGGTVTGATVQTAEGGARVVLDSDDNQMNVYSTAGTRRVALGVDGYELYNDAADIVAKIILDNGQSLGGFYCRNYQVGGSTAAFLSGGTLTSALADDPNSIFSNGFLQWVCSLGGGYVIQTLSTGRVTGADDAVRLQLVSESGFRPVAWVDGGSASDEADLRVTGRMYAGNMAVGSVAITPDGANVATSFLVTGLNVSGSTFYGFATANTTVPGDRSPGGSGVTGVSVSSVTAHSLMVWVNRQNTTNTTVNWMVIGQ